MAINIFCILAEPLKNRSTTTITAAWQSLHATYERAAVAPHIYILNNEFFQELRVALQDKQCAFQLVPPHSHRNNLAERAIQTWKSHFKAGLASCDPDFLLAEWDRLLPQANLTLNLLQSSRSNPKLSTWAFLFGEFNFNKTPMASPGTIIIAHVHAAKQKSWDLHRESGWYVGPALEHFDV